MHSLKSVNMECERSSSLFKETRSHSLSSTSSRNSNVHNQRLLAHHATHESNITTTQTVLHSCSIKEYCSRYPTFELSWFNALDGNDVRDAINFQKKCSRTTTSLHESSIPQQFKVFWYRKTQCQNNSQKRWKLDPRQSQFKPRPELISIIQSILTSGRSPSRIKSISKTAQTY
jgi:hypothetical protein